MRPGLEPALPSPGCEPEPTTAAVAASAGQDARLRPRPGGARIRGVRAAESAQAEEPTAGEPAADDSRRARTTAAAEESAAAGAPRLKSPGLRSPLRARGLRNQPATARPAKPAPGRVEVTVVPGVARYHRSECILIRFLGAGDLEIMTRQEAEDAKFVACRACQPDQLED